MSEAALDPKQIFLDALELNSPTELQRYLEEACAGNAEVRLRVEALLQAHRDVGNFLGGPPPSSPTVDGPMTDKSGTVIGPYKLLEQIGEGGMGTVWMAQQTQPVRRLVAVKLIKAGMDSRQVIARFEAERQALALMDHAHIARVLDAGTTDAGRPYFVMDLVKGVPITKYCDEHRLTPRQRLELFLPVCQAVQHAHQKGIIHRDLKPSNVLVALYDGKPVPKIIDFGVAKAVAQPLTEKTLVTGFGAIVGTLEYMSPEQAEINQLDIDTRSDIYSLGVLLYELLTGSPPFTRKELETAGLLETLRVIREQEPRKPSTRLSTAEGLPTLAANRGTEPAKLTRLVRGELDWIVMKALEKNRNRRYETATGFALDVQRYLNDEPVLACPPSAGYRLRKFARRNKAVLIAAGLICIAMFTAVGVLALSNVMITREKNEKEAALLQARKNEIEASDQRGIAVANAKIATDRAENLAWEDYINRVNRAYREIQDDNIALAEDLLLGCKPERRGWEWHYVLRLCHLDRLTLRPTGASINTVAYSPDGTWIAAGSGAPLWWGTDIFEAQVQLLDLATGRAKQVLRGIKGTIYSVAVSPDGSRIAVGSGHEARLTVWDAASGELLWSRSEPRFPAIVSVAFHPGGRFLAAGYGEYNGKSAGQVKLWEVATGREICALASSKKAVNKLAFHPDGKRLAIADWEHVEIWDIDARAKIRDLRAHTYWVRREAPDDGSNSVAFSHDGKWLATGGWDRTIRLWDAELGAEMPTVLGEHDGFVTDLAFSPDSRFLASTSEDRSVKLWGVPTGRRVAAFHGHSDHVFCVAFRPDGQELATGGLDGTVKIWNLKKSRPVVFDRHTTAVPDVAFRRDGHRVLSHPAAKGLHAKQALGERTMVWDPVTGDLDSALTGVNFQAHREEFELDVGVGKPTATSPDGQHVALIVTDGKLDRVSERSTDFAGNAVEIRASGSGQVIHRLIGHTGGVTCMAFSPDGQRLATASVDRTIKLWDVATGREVFTLRGHTAGVLSMAFSPDGHRTASGGIDNAVRIWDATLLPDDVLQPLEARFQQKLEKFWDMTHATDDFQRAADGQNTLGTQFANMGSLYEAIACFRMAIKIDPKHRNAFTNLGIAYYRQGNVDAAIASYRKAIDLDPEHASAHSNLGIALTAQGKPDEAIRCFHKALKIDSKHVHARTSLGIALMAQGKFDKATAWFREAVQLNPRPSGDLQYLGYCHYRTGNWRESIQALEKSCMLQPGGTGDCGQWIVLALAHARLAAQPGLPDKERDHHQAEARRRYEQADKQIESSWRVRPGNNSWLGQAIWDFREEARKLMGAKETK